MPWILLIYKARMKHMISRHLGWLLVAMALAIPSFGMAQTQGDESENTLWFAVDTLNQGLGEPSEEVNRSTPRAAVRSFIELANKHEFATAAHLLNLSELSPQEQAERGSELAQHLAEVFKRGERITPGNLSGRQDAAIESSAAQNPQAGKPRRDIEITVLKAKGDVYDIRLGRYRVGDSDPIWLIMPDSVRAIPVLYNEYGPSMLEDYIPERFKTSLGVLMIWEWLAIPLFVLLVGAVGWATYHLVNLFARILPKGAQSIFAGRIKVPMALVVMSLVMQVLLDYVVSFSAVATTTFRVLLIAVLAWGTGTIALRLVDTIMLRMTRRLVGEIDDTNPRDQRRLLTSLYALRRLIILITVIAVSVYILGQIQLFESLGVSLLASASVLAVLVGIAGQAVLGNILSSFQLSLAKPVRIGDLVIFEGQWCYVEGIFYTFIRLRVWDERRLIVPVTYFVSKPFENLSVKNTKLYRSLELTLHISADVAELREQFCELAKAQDNVIEHHKLLFYVTDQTATTLKLTGYFMTSDPIAGWSVEMEIREGLISFVRDVHPEWWPREVMVISHSDITQGDGQKPRQRVSSAADESDSEQRLKEDAQANERSGQSKTHAALPKDTGNGGDGGGSDGGGAS